MMRARAVGCSCGAEEWRSLGRQKCWYVVVPYAFSLPSTPARDTSHHRVALSQQHSNDKTTEFVRLNVHHHVILTSYVDCFDRRWFPIKQTPPNFPTMKTTGRPPPARRQLPNLRPLAPCLLRANSKIQPCWLCSFLDRRLYQKNQHVGEDQSINEAREDKDEAKQQE
jgi:hypothetical protein